MTASRGCTPRESCSRWDARTPVDAMPELTTGSASARARAGWRSGRPITSSPRLEARGRACCVERVPITTLGDRVTTWRCRGSATRASSRESSRTACGSGTIDLAVHSLKDLPTELPTGLALGAVLDARIRATRSSRATARRLGDSWRRARASAPRRCGGRRSCSRSGPTCDVRRPARQRADAGRQGGCAARLRRRGARARGARRLGLDRTSPSLRPRGAWFPRPARARWPCRCASDDAPALRCWRRSTDETTRLETAAERRCSATSRAAARCLSARWPR